jgi:hypothetical protein
MQGGMIKMRSKRECEDDWDLVPIRRSFEGFLGRRIFNTPEDD